jgi:hypothetical protein
LTLGLAGLQSPVVTSGVSGNVTSSNFRTLSWTGVETLATSDITAPTVQSGNFNYNGVPVSGRRVQALDFVFSEDVSPRLRTTTLTLTNLTSGAVIPASNLALSFTVATRTARFTFPGYTNGILPDGNYRAVFPAGSVFDAAGNPLALDYAYSFFVLTGDANRDREISFPDLLAVSTNFGKPNATYAMGDTDGDGQVSFPDLLVISSKFGRKLAAPTAAAPAAASVAPPAVFSATPIASPTRKAPARRAASVFA